MYKYRQISFGEPKPKDPFKISIASKELTHDCEDSECHIALVMTSLCDHFNIKQEQGESLADHSERFKNAEDTKDDLHGSFI